MKIFFYRKLSQVKTSLKNKFISQNCHLLNRMKPGAQAEIFQSRGGLVGFGHFYKHFVKNTRKKAPQGKFWEFFLLDTLKLHFERKFNSKMDTVRAFFKISGQFLSDFQNKPGDAFWSSSPPSWVPGNHATTWSWNQNFLIPSSSYLKV